MDKFDALIEDEDDVLRNFFRYLFFVPSDFPIARRFGVAILFTSLAFGLRDVLGDKLMFSFPFGFFIPASLLAAWFGGFAAGIGTVVAGALIGVYFFLEPYNNWGPLTNYGGWALGFHLITSCTGIILISFARYQCWKLAHEVVLLRAKAIDALTRDS